VLSALAGRADSAATTAAAATEKAFMTRMVLDSPPRRLP
jgi:hypothetical protein